MQAGRRPACRKHVALTTPLRRGTLGQIQDPRPESLLLPYLRDTDQHGVLAAWRAFGAEAARLLGDAGLDAQRAAWFRALPKAPADAAAVAAARPALNAWIAAKPQ